MRLPSPGNRGTPSPECDSDIRVREGSQLRSARSSSNSFETHRQHRVKQSAFIIAVLGPCPGHERRTKAPSRPVEPWSGESLRFHPAALEEAEAAVDWYAQRSGRAAGMFLDAIRI